MLFRLRRLRPGDEALLDRVVPDVFDEPVRRDRLGAYLATPGHRASARKSSRPSETDSHPSGQSVLCAGGRGNLDDAASAILAQLLERGGARTRLVPFDALASAAYAGLDMREVRMVCLSYMNPDSLAHARYLVRRLRRRTDASIFVGFWSLRIEDAERTDLTAVTRADLSATSLEAAVNLILDSAQDEAPGERR